MPSMALYSSDSSLAWIDQRQPVYMADNASDSHTTRWLLVYLLSLLVCWRRKKEKKARGMPQTRTTRHRHYAVHVLWCERRTGALGPGQVEGFFEPRNTKQMNGRKYRKDIEIQWNMGISLE